MENNGNQLSEFPEIAELQQSVAAELKANPDMLGYMLNIQKRILFVKGAINSAITEINRLAIESGDKANSSACCHAIAFRMTENGLYYYHCQTEGLVFESDDEEYLTDVGRMVKERIRAQGITQTIFYYSDLPF